MFLIFPTNQTWIVGIFFLQLVLLIKIGVERLVHGICKWTLFFKKTMFSFKSFKLLDGVYNVIRASMKLTQQGVRNMVKGCLYNQVSSILTKYILFIWQIVTIGSKFYNCKFFIDFNGCMCCMANELVIVIFCIHHVSHVWQLKD